MWMKLSTYSRYSRTTCPRRPNTSNAIPPPHPSLSVASRIGRTQPACIDKPSLGYSNLQIDLPSAENYCKGSKLRDRTAPTDHAAFLIPFESSMNEPDRVFELYLLSRFQSCCHVHEQGRDQYFLINVTSPCFVKLVCHTWPVIPWNDADECQETFHSHSVAVSPSGVEVISSFLGLTEHNNGSVRPCDPIVILHRLVQVLAPVPKTNTKHITVCSGFTSSIPVTR